MERVSIGNPLRRYVLKNALLQGAAAAVLWLLLSSPVCADPIQIISANRFVSVSGQAGNSKGSAYSDSQSATQLNSFNGSVSGSVDWASPMDPAYWSHADSYAAQTSSFGGSQFSLSQNVSAFFCTPLPGGGFAQAIAQAFFQVTFSVSEAVNFQLTSSGGGVGTAPNTLYSQTFSLTGMDLVLGGTYSGVLLPGTYVLTVWQQLNGLGQDPIGEGGWASSSVEMQFSSVPESGGFICMLLGVVGVMVFQRKTRKSLAPILRQAGSL